MSVDYQQSLSNFPQQQQPQQQNNTNCNNDPLRQFSINNSLMSSHQPFLQIQQTQIQQPPLSQQQTERIENQWQWIPDTHQERFDDEMTHTGIMPGQQQQQIMHYSIVLYPLNPQGKIEVRSSPISTTTTTSATVSTDFGVSGSDVNFYCSSSHSSVCTTPSSSQTATSIASSLPSSPANTSGYFSFHPSQQSTVSSSPSQSSNRIHPIFPRYMVLMEQNVSNRPLFIPIEFLTQEISWRLYIQASFFLEYALRFSPCGMQLNIDTDVQILCASGNALCRCYDNQQANAFFVNLPIQPCHLRLEKVGNCDQLVFTLNPRSNKAEEFPEPFDLFKLRVKINGSWLEFQFRGSRFHQDAPCYRFL